MSSCYKWIGPVKRQLNRAADDFHLCKFFGTLHWSREMVILLAIFSACNLMHRCMDGEVASHGEFGVEG